MSTCKGERGSRTRLHMLNQLESMNPLSDLGFQRSSSQRLTQAATSGTRLTSRLRHSFPAHARESDSAYWRCKLLRKYVGSMSCCREPSVHVKRDQYAVEVHGKLDLSNSCLEWDFFRRGRLRHATCQAASATHPGRLATRPSVTRLAHGSCSNLSSSHCTLHSAQVRIQEGREASINGIPCTMYVARDIM